MLKERGLSQALLDAKLMIIQGNAKDPEAVQKVLLDPKGSQIVDQIVFGIGKMLSHVLVGSFRLNALTL